MFLGYGKFHIFVLILCGWAVSSDAIEVLSVSFMLPSATCELKLSSSDKGWLNAVIFIGKLMFFDIALFLYTATYGMYIRYLEFAVTAVCWFICPMHRQNHEFLITGYACD